MERFIRKQLRTEAQRKMGVGEIAGSKHGDCLVATRYCKEERDRIFGLLFPNNLVMPFPSSLQGPVLLVEGFASPGDP